MGNIVRAIDVIKSIGPDNVLTVNHLVDALNEAQAEERERAAHFCEWWAHCNFEAFPEQAFAARSCARGIREQRRPPPEFTAAAVSPSTEQE